MVWLPDEQPSPAVAKIASLPVAEREHRETPAMIVIASKPLGRARADELSLDSTPTGRLKSAFIAVFILNGDPKPSDLPLAPWARQRVK